MSIIKKSFLLCCALALTTSAFAATSTAVSTTNTASASKGATTKVSKELGVQPAQFTSCSAFTKNATDKKALLICLQQFNSKLTSKQLDSALSGYHHKSATMPATKSASKKQGVIASSTTKVTQAKTATSGQLSDATAKKLTDGNKPSSVKKKTTQQQQYSNLDAGLPIATPQSQSTNSTTKSTS
ncbi:MAG: hypothetical protein GY782_01785 [Gammaproteobacteria bacterium]|nr:hypothetical protein [Gammaproteobacteria bacterium]